MHKPYVWSLDVYSAVFFFFLNKIAGQELPRHTDWTFCTVSHRSKWIRCLQLVDT